MEAVVYTCQVISPMFIHGADTNYLELSSTAFKSSMRFWWRTLQKETGMELLKKEEALFGGVTIEDSLKTDEPEKNRKENDMDNETPLKKSKGRRSPVDIIVKPIERLNFVKKKPVPHKNFEKVAYAQNNTFQVTIMSRRGNHLEFYEKLFELSSILGGVGQRSRRGMGSYQILKKEYPFNNKEGELFTNSTLAGEIWERIQTISSCTFIRNKDVFNIEYDCGERLDELKLFRLKVLETNQTGSDKLCEIISNATHKIRENVMERVRTEELRSITCDDLHYCLGGIKPRQASPVCVSLAKYAKNGEAPQLYIVVSFLTIDYEKAVNIPEDKVKNVYQVQNSFFNLICKGLHEPNS